MAHGVVYTANIDVFDKCTFSFVYGSDIDNGYLVTKGALSTGEDAIYNATLDTTASAYLVANPAWNYDESNYANRYYESTYYNKANVPFRVYKLNADKHDRIEVSADAVDTTLVVGDTVGMGATGQITKDATSKFQGKVIGVRNLGGAAYNTGTAGTVDTTRTFYKIEVIAN